MNYRKYLREKRDPRSLGRILIQVAKGIKELHYMGYVHRDLKPDNIVLDTKPIRVRIIDFNRCVSRLEATDGSVVGTPGYFPNARELRNGSTLWDIWSLGAIILESDMEKDEYMVINSERGGLGKAAKHLEMKGVCRHLKAIVRGTLLCGRLSDMLKLDDIIQLLDQVSFRKL